VKLPDSGDNEGLMNNGLEYDLAGFTSCIGSIEVVHIRQWLISSNLKIAATGKEKFPSRAFEVMVNHRRKVLSATKAFYGSTNDKTIIKFDGAVMSIKNGLYSNYTRMIYEENGNMIEMRGMYHINDNGYHKWGTSMEPSKHSRTRAEMCWSEMCESLRKDVECFFGVLKQMFAILKYGCRFQDQSVMDHVFLTCVAIYNQRFMQSSSDEPWEELVSLHSLDADTDEADSDAAVFNRIRDINGVVPESGIGLPDGMAFEDEEDDTETDLDHDARKKMLIEHFNYLLSQDRILWPRRVGSSRPYLRK